MQRVHGHAAGAWAAGQPWGVWWRPTTESWQSRPPRLARAINILLSQGALEFQLKTHREHVRYS